MSRQRVELFGTWNVQLLCDVCQLIDKLVLFTYSRFSRYGGDFICYYRRSESCSGKLSTGPYFCFHLRFIKTSGIQDFSTLLRLLPSCHLPAADLEREQDFVLCHIPSR
jgi:hypothetical protein